MAFDGACHAEDDDAECEYDEYGFSIESNANGSAGMRWSGPVNVDKNNNKVWDRFMEELVDTGNVARTRQLKLLVRGGVPGTFRGKLWPLLAGTAELRRQFPPRHYEELLQRAEAVQEKQPEVHAAIDKDLQRTFPGHRMFATPDGLAALRSVLVAYSLHFPAVGYCQSLNFIVAMLLFFVNEEEAFWLLDAIVRKILPDNYYTTDMSGCHVDQECLRHLVMERFGESLRSSSLLGADWEVVTCKWFLCIFVNCLPLAATLRVWDVFFHDGEEALFRISLAIFKLYHEEPTNCCTGGGNQRDPGARVGSSTRALASLQKFACNVQDVDDLFHAAFSEPRCRVKAAQLHRLRRTLEPPLSSPPKQARDQKSNVQARDDGEQGSTRLTQANVPENAGLGAGGGASGAKEASVGRVLYKAPSFYVLLRDKSEPLDFALVDGYVSAAAPAAGSRVGSETPRSADGLDVNMPAVSPATASISCFESGDNSQVSDNLSKGRHFTAWWGRRRKQQVRDTGSHRPSHALQEGAARAAREEEEEDELAAEEAVSSPWDSGISLDRGFFDHGSCRTLQNGPGFCTGGSYRAHSGAMPEALRRARSCGNGAGMQTRSEPAHKHKEWPGRSRSNDGTPFSAVSVRRERSAEEEEIDESPLRVLPRVIFTPEPIPPEMDPTRPPIEVGNWKPSCAGGHGAQEGPHPTRGGVAAEVPVGEHVAGRGARENQEGCRENWRPNVPARRVSEGEDHGKPSPLLGTAAHRGRDEVCGAEQGAELLHAKIFENIDVIEEYLELYDFAS